MSKLYPLLTLERMPEIFDAEEIRELMALLIVSLVRSKEFHHLTRHQQAYTIDFCTSVQALLLRAYDSTHS
jgi:hypothetical protein